LPEDRVALVGGGQAEAGVRIPGLKGGNRPVSCSSFPLLISMTSCPKTIMWTRRGRSALGARRKNAASMSDKPTQIAALLHEAGETHHNAYRIVDDWASWYASWVIDHSELREILGVRPVRSELIHLLVSLGREYDEAAGALEGLLLLRPDRVLRLDPVAS
jgi:hypothetical protein